MTIKDKPQKNLEAKTPEDKKFNAWLICARINIKCTRLPLRERVHLRGGVDDIARDKQGKKSPRCGRYCRFAPATLGTRSNGIQTSPLINHTPQLNTVDLTLTSCTCLQRSTTSCNTPMSLIILIEETSNSQLNCLESS